jgi:hypothetical protein
MNIQDRLNAMRLSRRSLFAAAGALGASATLAQTGLFRLAAAAPADRLQHLLAASKDAPAESLQDILDITATTEALDVTVLGVAIDNIKNGKFSQAIPDLVLNVLTAARAQEQFHLEFFQSLGGRPLTQTFTLPDPSVVTDYNTLFGALVGQESREIASQLAAIATYTALGRSDLVKMSFQYTAEEAEHRLLSNYALGTRPVLDVAFEKVMYKTTSEFLADLYKIGLINGPYPLADYPGPGAIDATNVTEHVPGGPSAMCMAPVASPGQGAGSVYFKETGHYLSHGFKSYWDKYGGLAIFGYPISEEMTENGATVQYFERARFEWRPGSWPERFDVELGLLGDWVAGQRSLLGTAAFQPVSPPSGSGQWGSDNGWAKSIFFSQTGHNLGGGFKAYWEKYGGLAIFGYPISEEFQENGLTVQYFERQRFEWHPGAWPERFDVELGLLGSEYLKAKTG